MFFMCFLAPEKKKSHPSQGRDNKPQAAEFYSKCGIDCYMQPTITHLSKLMKGCKTKVFYLLLVEHLLFEFLHHLALVVYLIILQWQRDMWSRNSAFNVMYYIHWYSTDTLYTGFLCTLGSMSNHNYKFSACT